MGRVKAHQKCRSVIKFHLPSSLIYSSKYITLNICIIQWKEDQGKCNKIYPSTQVLQLCKCIATLCQRQEDFKLSAFMYALQFAPVKNVPEHLAITMGKKNIYIKIDILTLLCSPCPLEKANRDAFCRSVYYFLQGGDLDDLTGV